SRRPRCRGPRPCRGAVGRGTAPSRGEPRRARGRSVGSGSCQIDSGARAGVLPETCALESTVQALVQAVEAGVPVLDGCARLRPLHRSALLSVDLWRCVQDGDGLRAERAHAAPVLTVLLSGASVLREGGRDVIVEAGTALLAHADLAYRAAHPFGCGDTGCHVRPSAILLEELRLPRAPWTAVALPIRSHLRLLLAVEGVALRGADGLALE